MRTSFLHYAVYGPGMPMAGPLRLGGIPPTICSRCKMCQRPDESENHADKLPATNQW